MSSLIFWIILLVVGVFVVWRLSSQRYVLPCPSWLGWMVEMDNPFCKTNRAAEIIKDSGVVQGMTVADIGCGPGRVAIPLAHAVGETGTVVAVDIQQEMLDKVKAKAEGLSNITYLHAGLGEGKLPKTAFDRVYLVTVLGEIPDQEKALREVYEAMKPGGILCITEVIFDPHFQSQNKVKSLAQKCGFREDKIFGRKLAYSMTFEKTAL